MCHSFIWRSATHKSSACNQIQAIHAFNKKEYFRVRSSNWHYCFRASKTRNGAVVSWPHQGPGRPLFVTYLSPAVSGSFLCFFPERTLESRCTGSWPPQTSWTALCAEDRREHEDRDWESGHFRLQTDLMPHKTVLHKILDSHGRK